MSKYLFTSESVTKGHPDKICDQISDAILDAMIEQDPMSRVACETTVTTGQVLVMGEITTEAYVDVEKIVRETLTEIGYTRAKYGFDSETCSVLAKEALATNRNIKDLLIERKVLSKEDLDVILAPAEMTRPGIAGKELLKKIHESREELV